MERFRWKIFLFFVNHVSSNIIDFYKQLKKRLKYRDVKSRRPKSENFNNYSERVVCCYPVACIKEKLIVQVFSPYYDC